MVRLTVLSRMVDGLPLAEGVESDKELGPELEPLKPQAKVWIPLRIDVFIWDLEAYQKAFGRTISFKSVNHRFWKICISCFDREWRVLSNALREILSQKTGLSISGRIEQRIYATLWRQRQQCHTSLCFYQIR